MNLTTPDNTNPYYKSGFDLGYEMAGDNKTLRFEGDNPNMKQDTSFIKFIEGAVNGHNQYDNENPVQYHDLKSTESNLVTLLGVIGVISLITPIYIFSPSQIGLGALLGCTIGLPILFQAFKASSNKKDGFFGDVRGEQFDCEDCGKPFKVHADADVELK